MRINKIFILILIILVFALIYGIVKYNEIKDIKIDKDYEDKIVYSLDNQDKEIYIKDCKKRGGIFNECGSLCDSGEVCVQVCAFTCEDIGDKNYYCSYDERKIEACADIYEPVCGWNNPEKIQCIKYPCTDKYSNKCEACKNENVLYTTDGKCPA